MMIAENLQRIKNALPSNVLLVAISKFNPESAIEEAYAVGQRDFGESKVQELGGKYEHLPKDIRWHFIGHLQTNKVKYIAPYVYLIHSVDSLKLLKEINKHAIQNGRTINYLLQIHVAEEETKFGLTENECIEMLESDDWKALTNVQACGVMGMATNTDNNDQIRAEFVKIHQLFDTLKERFFKEDDSFKEISMGMSGDYSIAIEEGSTMVRIGSSIFGERHYNL
ncbi:MAG: YggS family pyridoxal phosphate-dependent enzyme [Paludibacteraceae bacterium]|nr:YggS family pyridoxal phosphate-dependent enzyme [Paludibacteraceae bacterium]